jgi:hypothetical protein
VHGAYSNLITRGEHVSGYLVKLWDVGDHLDGYIVLYAGLMGDPPTARLQNISYDPLDHSFSFSAEISPGLTQGPDGQFSRAYERSQFDGKIIGRRMKGILTVTRVPCQSKCTDVHSMVLNRSDDLTEIMTDFDSIDGWEAFIGTILRFRGAPPLKKEETQNNALRTPSKKELSYEPTVVELKGTLTVKTFFGPPNYGENPKTDSKEKEWILKLNEPVDVIGDDGYPETISVHGVRDLELVLSGRHSELIGKKVIAKGTLFHAQTGHHHTDVLMEVQSINLQLNNVKAVH